MELRNDFGPNLDEMVYRIVTARPIGRFRLALRQLLLSDDQVALNAVMMKANHKIRVWSLQGADGGILVADGEIPGADGQETGWMEQCNVKWTGRDDKQERGILRKRNSPGQLAVK